MTKSIRRIAVALACTALCAGATGKARAQSAGPDADGDGVSDAQDCAPLDAAISTPHTYYWDTDGDQVGDGSQSVSLCTLMPFPGTVPWRGDRDDHDIRVTGLVAPKGSRHLGVDMLDAPASGEWQPDRGREIGADTLTVTLPWNQLEISAGSFNGPLVGVLGILDGIAARDGYRFNLTISAIAQTTLPLPSDLQSSIFSGTIRFNDPRITDRFNRMLDFVHGALPHATIASLQVGDDIDAFARILPNAQFWSDYAQFVSTVQPHAKALWGAGVTVAATASHTGLLDDTLAPLLQPVTAAGDVVSVTYLPRNADFTVPDPSGTPLDVQRLIARYYPKKLSFQAVGYPSSPRVLSSTTRQVQFVHAFFEAWDTYADLIPFVSFRHLNDLSATRAANDAVGAAATTAARANAAAWLGSSGLRTWDGDGTQKPAFYTLRTLTMMRGFWEVRPPATRSFLMGLVPAPYDLDPGGPPIPSVLDDLMGHVSRSADLITYYFDSGVPWREAFADTFASADPPYSAQLKSWWASHRSRQPAGIKVAVAVNPLGIPRSRVAPYWGVGEGFYHDSTFNLVGTGVTADYQDRLLPSPWNGYALDSPEMKRAFLNYCRRVIDYFHPTYLITGVEVNLAFQENPDFFTRYIELQKYVYTALKADPAYRDVRIVASLVAEPFVTDELGVPLHEGPQQVGIDARHLGALDRLLPYIDIVGLSVYPIKSRLLAYQIPGGFFDNLFGKLRAHTDKPIAITETGYPAAPFEVNGQPFAATPEKQALFLEFLASEAEKHGGIEFISQYVLRDMTAYMTKLRARSQETPPFISPALVEFFKYFEFTGLYDANGAPRDAAALWDQLTARPLERPDRFSGSTTVASPDGSMTATFAADAGGHLQYTLMRAGVPLTGASAMGVFVDGVDLGTGITNLVASPATEATDVYAMRGVHATATSHYRQTVLTVRRQGVKDTVYSIEVRLFDDALAFRYVVPGDGPRTISGESTTWNLPAGSLVWHQINTNNYESNYRRARIGEFTDTIGGPFTVELPDGAGLLTVTEANLRHYSGMTFQADLGSTAIRAQFLDDASWQAQGGEATPWRLTIAAPTLDALVNSNAVSNLSDPPDPALFPQGLQTGWIQPGRAVWSWWSDFYSGYSFDIQKQYVDYATRLRADFVVVDAWWELGFPSGGRDAFQRLADLAAYARSGPRDVGIWVWKSSYDVIQPDARRTFFDQLRTAGVVGVKIDNVFASDSESVANVRLYEDILRDAARAHLMVNFHGSNKPTGLSRTYPNEITREGLMGLELSGLGWEQGVFTPANHNAAVPFVRMIAGPGDYTPVTFDARKLGDTTVTHQLALAGLMTSPLLHFADNPELLLAQPAVQDILRTLPTEWDDTIVQAPSRIGELAVMARRKGGRWYLFGINGNAASARDLAAQPLSFLGQGRYDAVLVSDATKTSFARAERRGVTARDTFDIHLLPGGGFVSVFEPVADLTRVVPQGFSSIPSAQSADGWAGAYAALRDHADFVAHPLDSGVPWPEAFASSDYRTYPAALRAQWEALRSADDAVLPGRSRLVSISPLDASTWVDLARYWGPAGTAPLPSPWNGYDFAQPEVRTAFLNYAVASVEFFHPSYLAIGVDANALLSKAPQRWNGFKDLIASVHDALKARYPALTVFVSVGYEDLLRLYPNSKALALALRDSYPRVLEQEVSDLLRHSDVVGLSTWPCRVADNRYVGSDGTLDRDYLDAGFAIAAALGKPVGVEQAGCASIDVPLGDAGVWRGSEARQQDVVNRLLHDAHVGNVAFIVNTVGRDHGAVYGADPVRLETGYSGLIRGDGTGKAALATWDSYRGGAAAVSTAATISTAAATRGIASANDGPTFTDLHAAVVALLAAPSAAATTMTLTDGSKKAPTPELFVRWQQFASLLPGFEPPSGTDPTSPWNYAEPYATAARATLMRRTLLWPYLDSVFTDAAAHGTTPLASVATRFSDPGAAAPATPVFTIGSQLLVAPVMEEGAGSVELYLPEGSTWRDWYTGQRYAGGQVIVVAAPLERIPLFVRESER